MCLQLRSQEKINTIVVCMMIILLIPVLSLAGEQGYYVVKDNETFLDTNSMGGTPITWQNKIWITENDVRIENDQDKDHVLLIDMDKGFIYQLDNKAKNYKKLDVPAGLKDMQGQKEIKSERLDLSRKFGDWDCYGIKMTTKAKEITLEAEYWLTKAVDIPNSLRRKVSKYFGLEQQNLTEELAKYEGYPVYVTLTMNTKDKSIKMNTLVMELKKMDIDPKLFEIPEDFSEVEAPFKKTEGKEEIDPNLLKALSPESEKKAE